MKILLSLILLMNLPAFANCRDVFDPKKEQLADLITPANYKDFKRGYNRGGLEIGIVMAIGIVIGTVVADFFPPMEVFFEDKESIEHRQD